MTESGWRSTAVVGLASEIFDGPFGSNLKSSDYVDEGARVVRLENIGHLRFNEEKRTFVSLDKYERLKKHTLRPDDVLFSSFVDEEVRVCLFPHGANEPAINKADCFCIRVNRSVCDPRWLASALACRSTYEELRSAVHGATRPRVNLTVLKSLQLRVPPLPEQRRIVAKIDSLSSKSKRAREQLKKSSLLLRRYRETFTERLFRGLQQEGWKRVPLANIAEIKSGLTLGKKYRPDTPLVERPYLRVANVQRGHLNLSEVKTVRLPQSDADRLVLEPGDVLMNEGGDRDKLGRGWVWDGQIEGCIHQNHVFRVRLKTDAISPTYLSRYANHFGQRYFLDEGKQTTNLASISMKKVAALPVLIPPSGDSRVVDRQLERIEQAERSMAAEISRASALLDKLDQAVLAKAFRGELVPQDPNDEPASMLLERIRAEREAVPAAKPRRGRARRS